MTDTTLRTPIPPVLLQAIARVGFVPYSDAEKPLPFAQGDQTLPLELFEEQQLKQVRFYLRQLPPDSCFNQVAWQFAAFFHLPANALQAITSQLNHSTSFAKAVTLPQAKPGPLAGLFMNWYQGEHFDETQVNTIAAQWRVDLYVSLGLLEKMSQASQTVASALELGNNRAKQLLH